MTDPTKRDRFDLSVLADSSRGHDAAIAIGRLRSSLDSWARAVTELTREKYTAEAEIEEWKLASGLERGGDPDGVTPAAMQQYWEGQERQLALCREALRGLLAMVDDTIYSTDSDREDRVEGACVIGLARELVEADR